MRLTAKQNPETIKRYGHVKPARGWRTRVCSARCPGTSYSCTIAKEHRGPHVAHNFLKKVVAVWDSGTLARASKDALVRASKTRGRKGIQRQEANGPLNTLSARFVGLFSHMEEIGLVILFVGFVLFAIEVIQVIFS